MQTLKFSRIIIGYLEEERLRPVDAQYTEL